MPTIVHCTLIIEEDMHSFVLISRNLKFQSVSGIDINKEKNNVMRIGASRGRSISCHGKFGFKWVTTFEIACISFDINKEGEITQKDE